MKKRVLKSIFAALMVASMALTFTACGEKEDPKVDAGGNVSASDDAVKPMTEEEYQATCEALGTSMTDLQAEAAKLDPNDKEAAAKLLEDLKKPFVDFATVTPPEKYNDAHAKFKTGCEAMVSYIDVVIEMTNETDATKLQDLTTKMQEYATTAMTDLAEGATLAEAADA